MQVLVFGPEFLEPDATCLGCIGFVVHCAVAQLYVVPALPQDSIHLVSGTANFIVGLVFLPLRNFLAGGEATKEGRVFYLFAVALFCSMFSLSRVYR
jgi:hypothetical protein